MAEAKLSITGAWWGTGGSAVWTAADFIQSGYDSANYRSKLAISTAGYTIVSSSKLVVEVEVYAVSSPAGLEVILTQDNSIAANNCQNDNANAASDDLEAACIARSYAYADAEGKTMLGPTNGVNMPAGSKYYLIFDVTSLEQDQAYYLYFIRCHHDGYTSSGWQEAYVSDIVPTLTYTNYTSCTAPTAFTATPNLFEDTVTLEWSGAIAGASNSINGYLIQYDDSVDGVTWNGWVDLKTVSSTEPSGSTTDTPGITRGAYRRYRIQTQGIAGSLYYSGYSTATPLVQKNQLPDTPISLTVSRTLIVSGSEITVTWPAGSDVDDNLFGYVLERSSDGGSTYSQVYTGSDLSYKETLTGSAAQQFRYRIRAKDSFGALSSGYRYSSIITINSSPIAPTSAYLDKEEYSPGDKVTLIWSGATDADGNIAEYVIGLRYNEVDAWTTHGSVANTTGSGSYEFVPQNVEYLQRIYMAVRAVDALGATSAWKSAGSVLRNDNPYAYIRSDDGGAYAAGTDMHLVTIAEANGDPSSFAKYMPYIFDGESWQRCIE